MRKILCAFYLCLISCYSFYAQVLDKTANDRLVIQHELVASKQVKENIYIHTDKDIYEPGEDLWFKAYILNGNDLKISQQTKIIFVELRKLGEKEVITKEIYDATNGFASGHLFLADILKDGTYQLIVHTKNTMENASKTILANKQIEIRESIIPKILIDSEFHKKTYERTDTVQLEIAVFSRSRVPYIEASVIAELFSTDKKIGRIKVKTDEKGEAKLTFPVKKTTNAAYIKLRVQYKGETVHYSVDIPFQNPAAIQFGMYPEGGNLVENLPNTVAFKAVDHHGKPLHVEGDLYEDGKKVRSFEVTHFGMGKFLFTPKPYKKYTVQLSNPVLDSTFQLPDIRKSGIKLQVDRSNQKNIHCSITKTTDISPQKVYIRVQNRGNVYWMATASLTKDRIRFKIPCNKLPQGIAEVTIFNERFQPLAERLVYANLDQKLHVKLEEISKMLYRQKEKVNMRFSVKDQFGKPAIGHFSLSVFDHLYAKKDNHYSILPHYYLFSELKGHVYNASYYFDEKNKDRDKHLDLVLLTQGWRTYIWNPENLLDAHDYVKPFREEVTGRAFQVTKEKTLKNAKGAEIKVVLPKRITSIHTDSNGNFALPVNYLKIGRGYEITFLPINSESIILEATFPFDEIGKRTKKKLLLFPKSDRLVSEKKQSSYDSEFSFNETNYLEEVKLTGYKDRDKNSGENVIYKDFPSGDYVCHEYGVLNCRNHRSGSPPIEGKRYRLNSGQYVVFGNTKVKKGEKKTAFLMVKGFYPTKEFYNPTYDKAEDKLFPDNRKTLFWSPKLISNEKGEINVSFYTSDVQTTFFGRLEGTNGSGLFGANYFQFNVN
ncbi:MG2 domain-containing protein [Kordia sp.]|uniref:MG2 domain-containing protein n=1 Tax=Kordia sp. TaxID=1965332 RepID=UPI003D296C60